jgi:hypothetical protein
MFFDETSGPIVPKFYHVLAQGWALNLQLNQSSQPFDYFPHFFAQHFVHDFDYPIPQLQASLDVCAHIPSTLWVSTSYIVLMDKRARTHDAVRDTFVAIAQNDGFHMGQE